MQKEKKKKKKKQRRHNHFPLTETQAPLAQPLTHRRH